MQTFTAIRNHPHPNPLAVYLERGQRRSGKYSCHDEEVSWPGGISPVDRKPRSRKTLFLLYCG
jgi:hypothetical protein